MVQRKALIFGASGCIGRHLVEYLLTRGYWVRCVCSLRSHCSIGHHTIYGDVTDMCFVKQCFQTNDGSHFDEVYQLAADMGGAMYNNSGAYDADIMSNSSLININILKCSVMHNAKKIFFPSSACVYPVDIDNNAKCVEEDAFPAYPEYGYGWEKLFTEKMLYSFSRQYGINVRIARLHSIVGEHSKWHGGREKAHSALARKVAEVEDGGTIEVLGDGTQIRTFLYVKDCVDGIYKLMQSECSEPINIGSDVPISINEYIDVLRKVSKKNFNVSFVPGPIGVQTRHCHIGKAARLIGWKPTTNIYDATASTYAWICEQISKPPEM